MGASSVNCAGVIERGGEIAGKGVGLGSFDAVFSKAWEALGGRSPESDRCN